jgi:hypothetical protein
MWLVAIKAWEMEYIGGEEGIRERYDKERRSILGEWK